MIYYAILHYVISLFPEFLAQLGAQETGGRLLAEWHVVRDITCRAVRAGSKVGFAYKLNVGAGFREPSSRLINTT